MQVEYKVPNCWACSKSFQKWSDHESHVQNCKRPQRIGDNYGGRDPSWAMERLMRQKPYLGGGDEEDANTRDTG